MASRDELWLRGVLLERRTTYGQAVVRDGVLHARDVLADARLLAACDDAALRAEPLVRALTDARVRLVTTCDSATEATTTLTITIDGVSIVSDAEHADDDAAVLRALVAQPPTAAYVEPLPLVWRNGTAAVLFHEAAGHPAEHGAPPLAWPQWLEVRDVAKAGDADLLRGELPRALRRATFRDVPRPRMSRVVVAQRDAPWPTPRSHVEVLLVAGGGYDAVTDEVTLRIAIADRIDGERRTRLAPFALQAPRARVARAVAGARGEPRRYPGVICSREGQELVVGSFAADVLTEPFA